MSPAVSIIIATYNYAHYLPGALNSLLAQTFADWEAIVVDDGSTDNTVKAVSPYLNDPRVHYHRTENRGQPAAENVGIRLARGKYIAFLDADDAWLPSKLERQLPIFERNPAPGVVFCGRTVVDPHGNAISRPSLPFFRNNVLVPIFRNNFVCFSSSIVDRKVFRHVGLFNEEYRHASDYEFWLRVAMHFEFDYLDEPLVSYRVGHANLTSNGTAQLAAGMKIMDRFLAEHRDRLPRLHVRKCYGETYLHYAQAMQKDSSSRAMLWNLRSLLSWPFFRESWSNLLSLILPGFIVDPLRRIKYQAQFERFDRSLE